MIKTLKYFLFSILTLLILLISASIVLWFNLEVLVTNQRLENLQTKYLPDLNLNWDKINLEIDSEGFFNKRIHLNSHDLCLKYKTSQFCFQKIDLSVHVTPMKKPLFQIDKLTLIDKKILVNLKDFTTNENKKKTFTPLQKTLSDSLKQAATFWVFFPKKIKLELHPGLMSKDKNLQSFSLKLNDSNLDFRFQKTHLQIRSKSKFKHSRKALIKLNSKLSKIQTRGSFQLDLQDQVRLQGDLELKFIQKTKNTPNEHKINAQILVTSNSDKTLIELKQVSTGFKPYLKSLDIKLCSLKITKKNGNNIFFNCPLIKAQPSLKQFKTAYIKKQVSKLGPLKLSISGEFDEKNILFSSTGQKIIDLGHLKAKLEEVKNKTFDLNFSSKIGIKKNKKGIKAWPQKLSFSLDIKSFQSLVAELKSSPYAVPAPFNQFTGRIFININKLIGDLKKLTIPVKAGIKLASKQKDAINIDSKAQITLVKNNKQPSMKADLTINKFKLHLPDFDPIQGLPKLNSDSRIVNTRSSKQEDLIQNSQRTAQDLKKTKPSFTYDVKLKTKNKDSIQIMYKLFDPYLPLGFKAHLTNKGMTYKVFSHVDWSVAYLNRRAKILSMNLEKKKMMSDNMTVDTEILYAASNYNIYITILGNIDSPAVKFRSDPPLSRKNIISVLLYNRTADDLTRFQNESVGGTDSAISDKAIGLLGIWAFAATPIESVSYNAKTNVYRAQMALPGGVKLDIGTDWERVQNLSLRKRVSEYWSIVTSYEPGDTDDGVGNVFLQREWIF